MTPQQAGILADRIAAAPGDTTTRNTWINTLTPLDYGTAGTALIRCLSETTTAPTPDQLAAKYATLHTPTTQPIPHASTCTRCDGNGSIAAWLTTHPTTGNKLAHPYRFAFNCPACHRRPQLADLPTNLPAGSTNPWPPDTLEHHDLRPHDARPHLTPGSDRA